MTTDAAMRALIDKDAIRDLVLLYSRAIDRKDPALLRDLYTADATELHGDSYEGSAAGYCDFIERSLPHMPYSGHHVCNHLVGVDGDEGDGEVYALAYHVIPDRDGGHVEDFMAVRYIDRYRRGEDGRWRFARRVVTYDLRIRRPFAGAVPGPGEDPSYALCPDPLFARGARTTRPAAR